MTIPSVSSANAARPAPRPASSQREDRAQRAAAHPRELLARDRRVRRRPALAADLQQHRGQPRAVDLALLGDRQRQRAARPLRARPRPAGVGAGLLPRGGLDRPLQRDRRVVAPVRPRHDPRLVPLARREVAEHEHAVDQRRDPARAPRRALPRRRRSLRRSRPARASCAGRARRAAAGRRSARSASASAPASRVRKMRAELEQRRGAGQLGEPRAVGRVAVGEDDDPPVRQPRADADHRLEVALAVDGPPARRAAVDVEPRAAQRRGDAVGQRVVAGGARAALGERAAELQQRAREPLAAVRAARVERVRDRARAHGRRPSLEREGDDEDGEQGGDEGRPVDPDVEHGPARYLRLQHAGPSATHLAGR